MGSRYKSNFSAENICAVAARFGWHYQYGDLQEQRNLDKLERLGQIKKNNKGGLLALPAPAGGMPGPDIHAYATGPGPAILPAGSGSSPRAPYEVLFESSVRTWKIIDTFANEAVWYPKRGVEPKLVMDNGGTYACIDDAGGRYLCDSLFRGQEN